MTVTASSELFIGQWQNAARLRAVVDLWIETLNEYASLPLARLRIMDRIDTAEGVWLDKIGERLGLARPWDTRRTDDRWGFDQAGIPFDLGRFSNEPEFEARTPIADYLYRNLLRARAVLLLSIGRHVDMLRALQFIDPGVTVTDLHNMTFRVVTSEMRDIELAERAGAIPRPAGVRMIVEDRTRWGFDQAGTPFDQGGFVS